MAARSDKKELLQTEGTVILHITSALKHDPELRKEFGKSLKVDCVKLRMTGTFIKLFVYSEQASQSRLSAGTLSLFNLALVFSIARIYIFEETVSS